MHIFIIVKKLTFQAKFEVEDELKIPYICRHKMAAEFRHNFDKQTTRLQSPTWRHSWDKNNTLSKFPGLLEQNHGSAFLKGNCKALAQIVSSKVLQKWINWYQIIRIFYY